MPGKIPWWPALAGGVAPALLGLGAWAVTGLAGSPPPPAFPSPQAALAPSPTPTGAPRAPATAHPVAHFAPLRPPIVYAALGASDTVGMGATDPDTQNWAAQLAAKLPPGTHFQRFAQNGITLGESLRTQVPAAIASNPDLITAWLVVNDGLRRVAPATYRAELHTLLTRLTQETHAAVVLLNAPDMSLILPTQVTPTTRLAVQTLTRQWNQLIAQEAAAFPDRVLLVDLYAPSQQAAGRPDWVSPDRFHPSSAGYAALAAVVYAALQQAGLVAP